MSISSSLKEDIDMEKNTGDKELEKIYEELKSHRVNTETHYTGRSTGSRDNSGDLLQFFIGLLMLAAGLYMILQNINVTSNWGLYSYHIGSFHLSSGMVLLPTIIGIGMVFMMDKKGFGLAVLAVGVVIILASVFMTTHIYWKTTSAYEFIFMFGLTAGGAGLIIKQLFKGSKS